MKVGSFTPEQSDRVLYAMAGDDCSLHHDLDRLTAKQQIDHRENQVLTCALQVALIGLGKPIDHIALAREFSQAPWSDLLSHYRHMFTSMGLPTIPGAQQQFFDLDGFYAACADNLPPVDRVNLYMVSGSNGALHNDQRALGVSQNVNSKVHFAEHAPGAGIPVPFTAVLSQQAVASGAAADLFGRYPEGMIVKLLGLAGARNVFHVVDEQDCQAQTEQYPPEAPVILQERLDTSCWQEMTVDLTITPDNVAINNVRKILFAGGKWVGNYIATDVALKEAHRKVLLAVGDYARHHGHVAEDGVNCGVDFFINGDAITVTEINARWTGGLFPAEFLRRLNVRQPAVAFFDLVPAALLGDALPAFQSRHLLQPGRESPFAYLPMGFTPFATSLDGDEVFFVWQIVVGDFAGFVAACGSELPAGAFPTARAILAEALS